MKKMITMSIAAGLVAVASAGVSTTFDFASAYVFRGVTLNDGAVFQPGIEVYGLEVPEEYGAVAFGAWGNYDIDEYDGFGVSSSTFQETDWYVSYALPALIEGVDLAIGYTEYSYGTGSSDEEISLGAGFSISNVAFSLTYYQGVGGAIGTQSYIEGTAGFGLDLSENLSASIDASAGFLSPDAGEDGFHNYSVGVSIGGALSETWSWGISGTYIGQGDDEVLVDSDSTTLPDPTFGYDVDFVGMFSLACDM